MASSLYQHQLHLERDEIRTLTLKRGDLEDPVTCALHTVSLADQPIYTALSYVWGDPTLRLPIDVDGIPFSATKNLKLALQHIRKTDRDEVLWVDAVCINQTDIDERNNQVSLMGRLYSEAGGVIIWLGEPDETTDELVRIVNENGLPKLPAPEDEDYVKAHLQYAVRLTRLLTLFDIVALRPWWSRVWIVQECVLPRNDPVFQCGLRTFSWQNFFNMFYGVHNQAKSGLNSVQGHENDPSVRDIWQYRERLSKGVSQRERLQNVQGISILGIMRKHFKDASNIPLASCIIASVERKATVPHDYIYGFLGLAAAEERSEVVVDYRRSHWAAYRDFFELITKIAGPDELKILTMISFNTESDERPSWLPDFSSQRDVSRYTGLHLASEGCFGSLEEVSWSDDDEIIMLEGVSLDIIDQVHTMPEEKNGWLTHMLGLAQNIQAERATANDDHNSLSSPPPEIVEASKKTHISQLFLGNIRFDDSMNISASQIEDHWNIVAELHRAGAALNNFDSDEFKTPRAELGGTSFLSFIVRVVLQTYSVCTGRGVMISRAGLSGICVPNAQVGDEIVCLYGFHMPFILRPMDGHYRIVGGAYLPGLMDWSTLTECREKGRLREATFRIR
jgi:hypothetical protein